MSESEKGPIQEQVAEDNQPATSPPQVIVQQAVIKGSLLGGVLLVLFVIGAVLVYLLTGAVGWDNDSIRIISAMCVGPLLGLAVFGVWVLIQRGKSAHG
ncbi:hypothetical protein ANRL2_01495 [Anaerolineae bacterium]|nr:hypothetical protein ANRL2_01495 [Anaerolineae bacterium]